MAEKDQFLNNAGLVLLCKKIIARLNGKANATHKHTAESIDSGTLADERLPVVPIKKGGTGATTEVAALKNLGAYGESNKPTPADIGAAPAYTYGTEDLKAGESALETGKLYFVYE